MAPLAGLVTAALMLWHLSTPALWLDESASAVATGRTWTHLWRLLRGTDAPLVPYYAVIKAADRVAVTLVPTFAHHQALMLRWPSASAMIVAVTLLTRWVQQATSTSISAAAAAILLAMTGLSRYGQEARPYALVLMMAVIATVVWWHALRTRSPWAWPGYAIAVAALVVLHALAASLILVHLLAAPLMRAGTGAPTGRRRRTLLTLAFAAVGLALAAPMTAQAVLNGGGATEHPPDDLHGLLMSGVGDVFGHDPNLIWPATGLLLLCVAGLTRWSSPRFGDLVRLSALWSVLPTLLWVAAAQAEPSLSIGRYILFVLPGLAVLAAIGLFTAARVLAWVWAGKLAGWAARPEAATRLKYLTRALMVPPLIVLAVLQWPAMVSVRTPAGHDEDIRPSLNAVDQGLYRHLLIYVSPGSDAVEIQAIDPADDARLLNVRPQGNAAPVWPSQLSPAQVDQELQDAPAVVFLVRKQHCLPEPASQVGYRVLATLPHGPRWYAYVAARAPTGQRPAICSSTRS